MISYRKFKFSNERIAKKATVAGEIKAEH